MNLTSFPPTYFHTDKTATACTSLVEWLETVLKINTPIWTNVHLLCTASCSLQKQTHIVAARFDTYRVCFNRIWGCRSSSWQVTDQMWQRFMLLSLTSIILHPVCQLHCARQQWKKSSLTMAWSQSRVVLMSTWHQTCMSVSHVQKWEAVSGAF